MTEQTIYMILISLLFTIIWALLFYLFKKNDEKVETLNKTFDGHLQSNCRVHSIKISTLENQISEFRNKLWSEDKLTKVVEKAIESQFNRWENKLMKEGQLNINNKENDK